MTLLIIGFWIDDNRPNAASVAARLAVAANKGLPGIKIPMEVRGLELKEDDGTNAVIYPVTSVQEIRQAVKRESQLHNLGEVPIDRLAISTPAMRALIDAGLKTFGQLCRLTKTQVKAIHGIGKQYLQEIEVELGRLALSLRPE